MEQSNSKVVQSMNDDKDNEPSNTEQNTVTAEQSMSDVVQSSTVVPR